LPSLNRLIEACLDIQREFGRLTPAANEMLGGPARALSQANLAAADRSQLKKKTITLLLERFVERFWVIFQVRLESIVEENLFEMTRLSRIFKLWRIKMDMELIALIAGIISSVMFVSSHVPMLLKAYRTRDLHSYSSLNIVLVNIGNLIYWLYIIKLPFGPIWLLHTFYTLSSGLLLMLYCRLPLSHYIKWYVCKFHLKKCVQI
jgi:uncharacterized protein with PQ loop repeat